MAKCLKCGGRVNANGNCFTSGCVNSNDNRHQPIGGMPKEPPVRKAQVRRLVKLLEAAEAELCAEPGRSRDQGYTRAVKALQAVEDKSTRAECAQARRQAKTT